MTDDFLCEACGGVCPESACDHRTLHDTCLLEGGWCVECRGRLLRDRADDQRLDEAEF